LQAARAGYRKGPTTEHGTPVSRYEQLMTAGGPQMLATSNIVAILYKKLLPQTDRATRCQSKSSPVKKQAVQQIHDKSKYWSYM